MFLNFHSTLPNLSDEYLADIKAHQLASHLLGFNLKTIWFLRIFDIKIIGAANRKHLWWLRHSVTLRFRLYAKKTGCIGIWCSTWIEGSFNRTWVDIKTILQPWAILRKHVESSVENYLRTTQETALWIQKLPTIRKYRTQAQYVNYSRHDPSIKQWIYTLIGFSQRSRWSDAQKITSRVANDFIEILPLFVVENSLDEQETVRSRHSGLQFHWNSQKMRH